MPQTKPKMDPQKDTLSKSTNKQKTSSSKSETNKKHAKTIGVEKSERKSEILPSSVVSEVNEIPVIVNGETKWISGLNNETTSQDVLRVILETQTRTEKLQESQLRKYGLSERWKNVEKPLRHSVKLLSLWNSWGQDRKSVR